MQSSNTVFTSQYSNMLSKERNLRNEKSETTSHLLMDSIYLFLTYRTTLWFHWIYKFCICFHASALHISGWQNLARKQSASSAKTFGIHYM